ncbi:MAG: hypothetical protein JWL90_996 [Chthoniobacteraceae bacterium]|nr:hypothetical protein [Chthoniobacteraceae bacterium]
MEPATDNAGRFPPQRTHARHFNPATWAAVNVSPLHLTPGQGKIMAPFFVHEAKIDARGFPFRSMCCDAAASVAMVRDEMRQLVAQRSVNFLHPKRNQLRIKHDQCLARKRHPRRAAHPRIPLQPHMGRQIGAPGFAQQVRGLF